MNINSITKRYCVKELKTNDSKSVLDLYKSNHQYFEYCPPQPTIESVNDDLSTLPNNVDITDKHYLGFYDNNQLIGIIDLITNYPDKQTCFIGLFMIDSKYQNKGIGSSLIKDICVFLKANNYKYIRLAYGLNNNKAKAFWEKNGFIPIKQTISNGQLEVMLCSKEL